MEQSLMEKIFSNEHSLASLPTTRVELSEVDQSRLEIILEQMERISPVEADLVELHFLRGVPQGILGQIFGYTQPNVHYRLERGKKRLKALPNLPIYELDVLEKRLRGYLTDPKDIKVMVLIYKYSSQSKVAEIVGESQGKVRYRFLRCLKSLSNSPSMGDLYGAYKVIEENLTLLRKSEPRKNVKSIL